LAGLSMLERELRRDLGLGEPGAVQHFQQPLLVENPPASTIRIHCPNQDHRRQRLHAADSRGSDDARSGRHRAKSLKRQNGVPKVRSNRTSKYQIERAILELLRPDVVDTDGLFLYA